jgi:hypothetical protein
MLFWPQHDGLDAAPLLDKAYTRVGLQRSRVDREGAPSQSFDLWMTRRSGDQRIERAAANSRLTPGWSAVHREFSNMRLPLSRT